MPSPVLTNIRAGRHDCYDRLVLDTRGKSAGYRVLYVDTMTDVSGEVVPLRGGARLWINLSATYDRTDGPVFPCTNCAEVVNVSGYSTFRQVAWAGAYRHSTLVGLGVRALLPFRVFTLPGRLVIDVAHRW
ncbi:AMIN-like domain-containing (lipo)protein [Actinokineospora sp. 24-640]